MVELANDVASFQSCNIPSFDEMLSGRFIEYPFLSKYQDIHLDPVLICHTSGSTGWFHFTYLILRLRARD